MSKTTLVLFFSGERGGATKGRNEWYNFNMQVNLSMLLGAESGVVTHRKGAAFPKFQNPQMGRRHLSVPRLYGVTMMYTWQPSLGNVLRVLIQIVLNE